MKINKEFLINKILPIILTSFLSALISMLQAYLSQMGQNGIPNGAPEVSAVVGGSIMALKVFKC